VSGKVPLNELVGSKVMVIAAVSLPGRLVVATEISHRNNKITIEISIIIYKITLKSL